jgi:hypothetical protein
VVISDNYPFFSVLVQIADASFPEAPYVALDFLAMTVAIGRQGQVVWGYIDRGQDVFACHWRLTQ